MGSQPFQTLKYRILFSLYCWNKKSFFFWRNPIKNVQTPSYRKTEASVKSSRNTAAASSERGFRKIFFRGI